MLLCRAVAGDADRPALTRRDVLWRGSVGEFGIDRVRLPGGRVAELALLRHPGAAAVVPFVDAHSVLLLRQYRWAAGGEIWEVPAGKLDGGEPPEVCARRELEEETGYRAGRLEPTGEILTTPGFTDERIFLFAAFELVPGQLAHGPHELIAVHRVPLTRALAMIDSGELRDAKSVAALYRAARRVGAL
jgi:ADP-ribose pyrophosphatase